MGVEGSGGGRGQEGAACRAWLLLSLSHLSLISPHTPLTCSKLNTQHSRSRSLGVLPLHLDEQPAGAEAAAAAAAAGGAGPGASSAAVHQRLQSHLAQRARSCSPAELAGMAAQGAASASGTPAPAPASSAGSSTSMRQGGAGLAAGQSLRPPRPPAAPPSDPGSPPGDAGQQQAAEQQAEQQQQQQQAQRQETEEGEPARQAAPAAAPQRELEHMPSFSWLLGSRPPSRKPADADESLLLGEGWEAVDAGDASDDSLGLASRAFSTAHLLAPQSDHRGVAGMAPRATSSSSNAAGATLGGFIGAARAKVRCCSSLPPPPLALPGWCILRPCAAHLLLPLLSHFLSCRWWPQTW